MEKKIDTQNAREILETGHFPYLNQALFCAMTRCAAWRFSEDGTPYNVLEIFAFAKEMDEKRPENSTSFYMVSEEGAIGLSPGKEYLTRWLFIPMEEGSERDAVIARMKTVMDQLEEEEKQQEKANAPRFCIYCGAALPSSQSNFCPFCGKRLQ